MSDVEKQIEQWRVGLGNTEALGDRDIHELESHLREEMEHLKSLPLSDEEVFLVARHRLGDTAALDREFSKVNVHRRFLQRVCWGIMGVLLYFAALTFAGAAEVLSLRLEIMGDSGGPYTYSGIPQAIVRIVAFLGIVLLALWLYARHLHRGTNLRSRDSIAAPMLAPVALAIGTSAFVAVRILATQIVWRGATIDPMYRHTELEFQIAASLLLAGLFIVLYRRNRREAQYQP